MALTLVDFSKALNCLSSLHCIRSLAEKGASTEVLKIVASFLKNREIRVKVGDVMSEGVEISGRVPQGSLLGVYLFNTAIDRFECCSNDVQPYKVIGGDPDFEHKVEAAPDRVETDVKVPEETLTKRKLARWNSELLAVQKYIDNNQVLDKANFKTVENINGTKTKELARTQNFFRSREAANDCTI